MSSLILHCGGKPATFEQVAAIPMPERTATYTPVPYARLINMVRSHLEDVLGLEIRDEAYGLNRDGAQMFGVISTRTHDDHGLAIGLRSSHDRSISMASSVGDKVFVCDNMAFTSSGTVVMRQHRGDAFAAFRRMFRRQMESAVDTHQALTADFDALRQVEITQDRGYELIGRAIGHDILKPTQANIAVRDWQTPRHDVDAFRERTLYALYQCFTEGLKKGPAATVLDRHANAHDFFLRQTPRVVEA